MLNFQVFCKICVKYQFFKSRFFAQRIILSKCCGLSLLLGAKKPPAEAGGKEKRLFSGEIQGRTVQHPDVIEGQGVYVGHRLPVYGRGLVG